MAYCPPPVFKTVVPRRCRRGGPKPPFAPRSQGGLGSHALPPFVFRGGNPQAPGAYLASCREQMSRSRVRKDELCRQKRGISTLLLGRSWTHKRGSSGRRTWALHLLL